jgi:CHAT domain-containing protein/Tfp pilus assembly protein PilF
MPRNMEVCQRSRLSHFIVIFLLSFVMIMARDPAGRDPAGRALDRGVDADRRREKCKMFRMRVLWRCFVVRFFLLGAIVWLGSSLPAHSYAGAPSPGAPSPAPPQSRSSPEQLRGGESTQGPIAPGQSHIYAIDLAAGQYLHLEVELERIDLTVRLLSPEGKELEQRENLVENSSIPLSFVAPTGGTYRLEIQQPKRPDQKQDAKAGADKSSQLKMYQIKVDQLRPSEPDDQKRITAERAGSAGDKLRAEGTGPSRHEAVAQYEAALTVWTDLADQSRQADTLSSLGRAYYDLGDTNNALEFWNRELTVRHALGHPDDEGNVLGSIGTVYSRLGDRQKALDYFSQSVEKLRAAGDKVNEGTALSSIGNTYYGLGQVRKALEYYNQALPLQHGVGSPSAEGATLGNMGIAYSALGEPQKALDYSRQALQLALAAGDLDGQAATLTSIASLYWQLGDWDHALENQKSAVELTKKSGNRSFEAMILNNMGTTYRGLGDLDSALKCHEQALPILHDVGLPNEATALQNIGHVYRDKGEFQKAIDYYQQALKLYQARGNRRAVAQDLADTGEASLLLGQTGQAFENWGQAMPLAHASGDRILEASVLTGMARAHITEGKLDQAQASLDSALAMTESLRTAWVGADLRASYSSTVRDRYQLQIELLMLQHHDSQAFEASERARARSLLELLSESHANIRQGVDAALLAQEQALETDLRLKSEQRIRSQNTALDKDIEGLTVQYREVEAQIRTRSPRYAALTQPQPLTLDEIQKQILDPETLLLEYSLGEDRSFLWAVTSNSFHTYELPARTKLETAARLAYMQMSTSQVAGEAMQGAALALSHTLLGPVGAELGKKRLVVVAEGALQYIPFAALPAPASVNSAGTGVPLVADHEIVSLPSASTVALLRRETQGRAPAVKLAIVLADPVFSRDDPRVAQAGSGVSGNMSPKASDHASSDPGSKSSSSASTSASNSASNADDLERAELSQRSAKESGLPEFDRLRASRREAETIVELAGKNNAVEELDFDSSRETATSNALGQYRIIHIATHGLLNSRNPELSGLVFSLVDRQGKPQNGFLEARDIYNLKLGADLVVLSACQTALGKEIRGEGLVGLTRAFMYAGAPRVVASLWKVPDQATTELMQKFYRGILQQGLQPAAALRAAQFSMWKQPRRSAPYYWAGFTLQGEWK